MTQKHFVVPVKGELQKDHTRPQKFYDLALSSFFSSDGAKIGAVKQVR